MTKFAQTWCVLHEALRQSFHPQNILFALVGTLSTFVIWNVVGALFLGNAEVADQESPMILQVRSHHESLASSVESFSRRSINALLPSQTPERQPNAEHYRVPVPPFCVYARIADPIRRLFLVGHSWSTFFYYLSGGLGGILIWAYSGLPITRRTVLQVGTAKSLEFRDAIGFSRSHGYTTFSAVGIPLVGIAMMAIPIFALGFLMRWDVGVFVAGLMWILVTLFSCFMAVLALGLFLSWPLMWGAVCADDVDGFDAISRAYAYGMQRPLNYAIYLLVALSLAMLGWIAAWLIAEMVVALNYWCVEVGCGAVRLTEILQQTSPSEISDSSARPLMRYAGFLIRSVESLVRMTASSVSFSMFFSMAGAIYLLLRRDIDEAEFDQITDHVSSQ